MISVTPSPPQPSRTAWTSKPCPPCRGTTMPGSPCAPTPTPRSRSRTRPPRLWAASWDRLYNRVSSSKNRTGRQIFPSGAFLSFPTVSACGSRCGSGFLTRTVKQLFATKKSPKTEVFGDFCLRTSIWIFTTREIWPSGRRHFCAIQAFCRRQNLSAGGIHSRRACKIHCGIHKKDAGAKLYFTAVSEFQDITRNWVLD